MRIGIAGKDTQSAINTHPHERRAHALRQQPHDTNNSMPSSQSSSNSGSGANSSSSSSSSSTSTSSSSSNVTAFLSKLWRLVNDYNNNDLITWSQSGCSFVIINQIQFAKDLLPLYFKHSNIGSFIRQLNMYGFRKIPVVGSNGNTDQRSDVAQFYHVNFMRGQEQRLACIKRKNNSCKTHNLVVNGTFCEEVRSILNEVKAIRDGQNSSESILGALQVDNKSLWRDVAILRSQHHKQRRVIEKLIQFLLSLIQNRSNIVGKKRKVRLMINQSGMDMQSSATASGNSGGGCTNSGPSDMLNGHSSGLCSSNGNGNGADTNGGELCVNGSSRGVEHGIENGVGDNDDDDDNDEDDDDDDDNDDDDDDDDAEDDDDDGDDSGGSDGNGTRKSVGASTTVVSLSASHHLATSAHLTQVQPLSPNKGVLSIAPRSISVCSNSSLPGDCQQLASSNAPTTSSSSGADLIGLLGTSPGLLQLGGGGGSNGSALLRASPCDQQQQHYLAIDAAGGASSLGVHGSSPCDPQPQHYFASHSPMVGVTLGHNVTSTVSAAATGSNGTGSGSSNSNGSTGGGGQENINAGAGPLARGLANHGSGSGGRHGDGGSVGSSNGHADGAYLPFGNLGSQQQANQNNSLSNTNRNSTTTTSSSSNNNNNNNNNSNSSNGNNNQAGNNNLDITCHHVTQWTANSIYNTMADAGLSPTSNCSLGLAGANGMFNDLRLGSSNGGSCISAMESSGGTNQTSLTGGGARMSQNGGHNHGLSRHHNHHHNLHNHQTHHLSHHHQSQQQQQQQQQHHHHHYQQQQLQHNQQQQQQLNQQQQQQMNQQHHCFYS